MKTRIIAGLIGAIAFLVVIFFSNIPFVFAAGMALVGVLAVYELLSALQIPKVLKITAAIFAGLTPMLGQVPSFLLYINPGLQSPDNLPLVPMFAISYTINDFIYLFFALILLAILLISKKVEFTHTAKTFTAAVAITASLGLVIELIMWRSAGFSQGLPYGVTPEGIYLVFLVAIAAWMTDIGGYFTGRFLGGKIFKGRKLAPNLSPKKTIEGAIGGVIFCVIFFLVAEIIATQVFGIWTTLIWSNWSFGTFGEPTINWWIVLVVGPILSVCGMAGDLIASKIKRENQVKDFGGIMPGHGGALDRFDSLLVVAPVLYLILQILHRTI